MHDELAAQLARLFPEHAGLYTRCERKQAYPDVGTATAVARHRKQMAGLELYAYQCSYGDHWHLSHHAPTPEQRAQALALAQNEQTPASVLAEVKRRARARKRLQENLEAHRRAFRRAYERDLGTPFPSRLAAHYAELYRLLDEHLTLAARFLSAVYDEEWLRLSLQTCTEYGTPCASWRETLEARFARLAEHIDDLCERARQSMAAQRQELQEDEQRDLQACRKALTERYTTTLIPQ